MSGVGSTEPPRSGGVGLAGAGAGSVRATQTLLVTSLGAFMAFLDATIVNIAFPDLRASFPEASLAALSWVLNAYSIVFAALLVPAGRLADLYGRRRLFVWGLVVFGAASLLCALAPAEELLVAARVVQAAGAAVMVPTSLALLLPAFPPERRATAVGLWGAAAAVAAAIGPPLGGLLIEASDWRLVFLVNVPIAIAAIALGRRVLEESRDETALGLPDLVGAAVLALSIGALSLGLVKGNEWGWSSGRVLVSFAVAAALVPVALARSARHPSPALHLELFRVPSFAVANVGTLLFASAFFAMLLGNVLFLTEIWGYSILKAGLAIVPSPLAAAVFAGPAGRLSDRFGQRPVAAPGAIVFALGVGWLAWVAGPEPAYLREWLPGALLIGSGVGLTFPTLGSAAVAALGPRNFALGSAVSGTSRQLGAVLGVAILVAIVGAPGVAAAPSDFDAGWLFCAGAAIGAGLAALGLGRRRVIETTPLVEPA